jgi:hypothetical protein
MFVPISLPSDFTKLSNYILQDKSYSRVLGISLNRSYVFSTNLHPERDFLSSLHDFWGADIVSYNFDDKTQTEGKKLMAYLYSAEGRRLLSASSVGYVPVFIVDEPSYQSIRNDLGENRDYFEREMNKISYLKKVDIGLQNIILYKDMDFKPRFYLTTEKETLKKNTSYKTVDFHMINSSEYHIVFKKLSSPVYLNFTDLYSPEWRIRVGNFNWWDVLFNKKYFLSDSIHFQNAVRFNGFLIDPKKICKVNICRINKDGSYDFESTLYERPQSYLYLGLIISGSALIILIVGTLYLLRKDKK